MSECVPHLVEVCPKNDKIIEVFGGCVIPVWGQDEWGDALFVSGDNRASIVSKGCGYCFNCIIPEVSSIFFRKFEISDELVCEPKNAVAKVGEVR